MARVTLVVNNFDEGSETFLHSLTRQLVELGHEVTVHVLLEGRTSMRTGEAFETATVVRSAALPAVRSRWFVPAVVRLLRQEPAAVLTAVRRAVHLFGPGTRAARAIVVAAPLLATRPDVVHVAFSGIGVAISDALRLLEDDSKLIVSCRGSGELVAPGLDPSVMATLAELLRRAHVVHVVADVVADVVRSLGVPEGSISLIRPAVDVDLFHRSVDRAPSSGPLDVVSVTRLHWVKGIDVQIAAAAELAEVGIPFRWTIVGDGPDRAQLQLRARLAGIGSMVTFVGAVPQDRVRKIVESSDVFVSSSLSEGTSNSVLEAMSLGVPVVSSAAGGMSEVLTDGVDALVVPVGNPRRLADAVRHIAESPELVDRLSSGGVRTVKARFTVERQCDEWSRLYADVLAPSRIGIGKC